MTRELKMKEPYINEELIRIQIEAYEIHFIFTETVLQIGTSFSIARYGQSPAEFNPMERKGDLVALWRIIGCKAKGTSWKNEVIIQFDDYSEIKIPETNGHIRGSIVSRHEVDGKVLWQDF